METTKDTAKSPSAEKEKKNHHAGHRQRMHDRVKTYGFDSLAEHEALEYLLYFTNAQRDTNDIAHDLIERFGDFAGVVEASEKELCEVKGIGATAARLLHLLPEISGYYSRSRVSNKRCIKTSEQMGSYLMAKFACADYERALLVSLDNRRRVKATCWLNDGITNNVSLSVKDVVAAAIKGGTDSVVLAHNHPNGLALPSRDDLLTTEGVMRALGLIGVHLLDHFILTETEFLSMSEANRMPVYNFKEGTLAWPRGSFTP